MVISGISMGGNSDMGNRNAENAPNRISAKKEVKTAMGLFIRNFTITNS